MVDILTVKVILVTELESDKKYDFSELVCSSVRVFFLESVTQEARQIFSRNLLPRALLTRALEFMRWTGLISVSGVKRRFVVYFFVWLWRAVFLNLINYSSHWIDFFIGNI